MDRKNNGNEREGQASKGRKKQRKRTRSRDQEQGAKRRGAAWILHHHNPTNQKTKQNKAKPSPSPMWYARTYVYVCGAAGGQVARPRVPSQSGRRADASVHAPPPNHARTHAPPLTFAARAPSVGMCMRDNCAPAALRSALRAAHGSPLSPLAPPVTCRLHLRARGRRHARAPTASATAGFVPCLVPSSFASRGRRSFGALTQIIWIASLA